jgi:hypothetical protein
MAKETRRGKAIEKKLLRSRELDQDTFERLADAAGLIADAEDAFRRLAQSNL